MIKAYAEMIRDISGDNPDKRERHLKIIIDETDRLSSLVNDILDRSKLQAGVAEMNIESFDLAGCAGRGICSPSVLAEDFPISLSPLKATTRNIQRAMCASAITFSQSAQQ